MARANTPSPERVPKNGGRFRVLAYLRVSVAEARTGGHTLETQQARLAQKFDQVYGAGRWDMEVRQDDGVSGGLGIRPTRVSRKIRPGLAQCAVLLETRAYDAFAVYNLSRLARDMRVMEEFLDEYVLATHTAFFSATEDIDLSSSQGRLYVRLLTTVNTSQRETIIERNRDAAAARVEKGYALGDCCYGWQFESRENLAPGARCGALLPAPEQGKWVLHIQERFLSGWGLHKIARELNEWGVPTPEAVKGRRSRTDVPLASNAWRYASVLKTLTNPTHAGLVKMPRTGELLPGQFFVHRYYEPAVYEEVLRVRAERAACRGTNTQREGTSFASQLLLNGLLTCGRCGKRLYPSIQKNNERNARYTCQAGRLLPGKCVSCSGISAKVAILDETVVQAIARLAEQPLMREVLEQEACRALGEEETKLREAQGQLQGRLDKLDAQFLHWAEMAASQQITPEQFARFNAKMTGDQQEARKRLGEVAGRLAGREQREAQAAQVQTLLVQQFTSELGTGGQFPSLWRHLALEEKREVLRQLLERLSLDKAPDGKTPLLTLKVHLLPEQVVPVAQASVYPKRKGATRGVDALTPRQLALLYHLQQGKTEREAAQAMGVIPATVRRFIQGIRQALDVYEMNEAVRLCAARLHHEAHTLPLGAGKQPGNETSGPKCLSNKASAAGVALYLAPELIESLGLYASSARVKDVARILDISEAEALNRRNRILAATHARHMFEAVTAARRAGIPI